MTLAVIAAVATAGQALVAQVLAFRLAQTVHRAGMASNAESGNSTTPPGSLHSVS